MVTRRAFLLALLAPKRTYHRVPLAALATTKWTHVETRGLVTDVRKQDDGDIHITMEDADAKAVLEIIPAIPLPPPKKGAWIRAWGIARYDKAHGWPELHPLEGWSPR